jgi:hydrogenase/urease accessory protein HupE
MNKLKNSIVIMLLLLMAPSLSAHKLAPSLLRLAQQTENTFDVYWKTPAATSAGKNLQPVFPDHCSILGNPVSKLHSTALVWQWSIECQRDLTGETLAIKGMTETATASLVKIDWLDGRKIQQLLNADNAAFVIPFEQTMTHVMGEYIGLGIEHIWSGLDHLLFVLALLLLVPNLRLLIWTITSFTVGHSITLSLVVLGYIHYSVSLVEFAIAASIFILAVELTKLAQGSSSTARWIPSHSWLVAISFGLLHGMGFAGALKEVGLPLGDIPLALLSFNVGIEIGQVFFVLLALAVIVLGRRHLSWLARSGWWATVYSIGGLSAFWCFERGLAVL